MSEDLTESYKGSKPSFHNNWGLMFVLIFIFLFNLIFSVIAAFAAGGIYGVSFAETRNLLGNPDGTALAINISRVYHFISFVGAMLIPAWMFTVVNRTSLIREGGLNKPFQPRFLAMGLVSASSSFVLVNWIDGFMRSIQWPQALQYYAQRLDSSRQEMANTLLDMQELNELWICLFLVAVLPAVIEELLFRGILQNIFNSITGRIVRSIVLQALVFSVLHFSFYELPGIFMAGLAFGWLRAASGNTIYGMVAHFLFNATAVVLHYFSQANFRLTGVSDAYNQLHPGPVVALLALVPFVYSMIWFHRQIKNNQA